MKTLILILCAISMPAIGQYLRYERVYPAPYPSQEFDMPLHGQVVAVSTPKQRSFVFMRVVTDGQNHDYRIPINLQLKKNGNLAYVDSIIAGDFVGGYCHGNSDVVKILSLGSPPPPKVVIQKTNDSPIVLKIKYPVAFTNGTTNLVTLSFPQSSSDRPH